MPLMPLNVANLGLITIDVSGKIPKEQRGHQAMQYVEVLPETTFGEEDWNVRFPGDFENAYFWNHVISNGRTPRGVIGAWAHALPAMSKKKAGVDAWKPFESIGKLDDDFVPRSDISHTIFAYGGTKMPGRSEAVVVATTGHGTRELMAFHAGGPLVAQHEGPDQPQYSRHVFDIDADGNLDVTRHAGLHGPFQVRAWLDSYCQVPVPPLPPASSKQTAPPSTFVPPKNTSFAVLLNASDAADSSGYLGTHFSDTEAVLSKERGGPLWHATKIHNHGTTADGFDVRGGSIQMDALFTHSDGYDMPWQYELVDYVPATDGWFPLKVHYRRNLALKHQWCGKDVQGRWDWEVFSPITQLPPCTFTHDKSTATDDAGTSRPAASYPAVAPTLALAAHQAAGILFQPRVALLKGNPRTPAVYTAS